MVQHVATSSSSRLSRATLMNGGQRQSSHLQMKMYCHTCHLVQGSNSSLAGFLFYTHPTILMLSALWLENLLFRYWTRSQSGYFFRRMKGNTCVLMLVRSEHHFRTSCSSSCWLIMKQQHVATHTPLIYYAVRLCRLSWQYLQAGRWAG